MKIGGFILLLMGLSNILLAFLTGINPIGGIIWVIIGGYLISRANKKQREKEDRDNWINGKN